MIPLQRSAHDRIVLGVCGGIAQKLAVHPSWFRLAFVVAALASGVGIVIYAALALIMRPPGVVEASLLQRVRLNLLELRYTLLRSGAAIERWRVQRELAGEPEGLRTVVGVGAVLGGLFVLLWSFGLFWWLDAWRTIGLVVALVGLALLMPRRRTAAAPAAGARGPLFVVALVVLFGVVFAGAGAKAIDEAADAPAPARLVRDTEARTLERLRERHEADRQRIRDLEQRLERLEGTAPTAPEPTVEAPPRARQGVLVWPATP